MSSGVPAHRVKGHAVRPKVPEGHTVDLGSPLAGNATEACNGKITRSRNVTHY